MAEYEIKFSKARQARGLPGYAVMRLEARDQDGEFWQGISSHHTAKEAAAAARPQNGGAPRLRVRPPQGASVDGWG